MTYLVSSSTGSMLFQSTLPWRGVTINIHIQTGIRMTFQSTLSMRRATQSLFLPLLAMPISIHALREESDCKRRQNLRDYPISIHALREESDSRTTQTSVNAANFNPRSP